MFDRKHQRREENFFKNKRMILEDNHQFQKTLKMIARN
jgi:hypothetical protein